MEAFKFYSIQLQVQFYSLLVAHAVPLTERLTQTADSGATMTESSYAHTTAAAGDATLTYTANLSDKSNH